MQAKLKVLDLRVLAQNFYQEVCELAEEKLKKHDPPRLDVILNKSIHHYTIRYERLKAMQISMQAIIGGKEDIAEDPDTHASINLLRDNLDTSMACLDPKKEVHELERLEG
ncbi:unnamed protein product, partial [Onchocerca ochengi]|uniref:14_3_3 domain-containing protein n=1 Tax=Onchocerca ochengi TaxID=42157 RepID=A0A182EU83_ONCOC